MSEHLMGMLGLAVCVATLAAAAVFAVLRKRGEPRNGLEALVLLTGVAVLVAMGVTHDRQNTNWQRGNLAKARKNPMIGQVLDGMTLTERLGGYTGQTDAEGNGIRSVYYEIAAGSDRQMGGVFAQKPCIVLELGVNSDGRPVLAGATCVGRTAGEKWPDESDPDAFRTLCFWLPSEATIKHYVAEGGDVRKESRQEKAEAWLYDVESGRFFGRNMVYADGLGEKTTDVRDTKLYPKHFEAFVEQRMEKSP